MATLRFSSSVISQSKFRFYTLTMPSSVLARTCFVATRDEDPIEGFQRVLELKRAQQIADYIDAGLGTIPTSIILSAQAEAEFTVLGRGKTVQFKDTPRAFLVLDGQHRVYGFHLATSELRVPVVIYSGLSRRDESRLFIDINTKQKPVPNELLLDIRKLAEYQEDVETLLGQVFDLFNAESDSPLLGMLSPTKRHDGKLTRVTFNRALKPHIEVFGEADPEDIYTALAAYFSAFILGLEDLEIQNLITTPSLFRAMMLLFPDVGLRVTDRFGKKAYTAENFQNVLKPIFKKLKPAIFKSKAEDLHKAMGNALRSQFTL